MCWVGVGGRRGGGGGYLLIDVGDRVYSVVRRVEWLAQSGLVGFWLSFLHFLCWSSNGLEDLRGPSSYTWLGL